MADDIPRWERRGAMLRWCAGLAVADAVMIAITAARFAYDSTTRWIAVASAVVMLATAATFQWMSRRPISADALAWRTQTIRVGAWLGALWVIEISTNNLATPPVPLRDHIDNAFWLTIAVVMLAYTARAAHRAQAIGVGVSAGAWMGAVSGLIACTAGLVLIAFGTVLLARDPVNVTEWAARGASTTAPNIEAYFAFESLAGALGHLTVLGIVMGTLLGAIGGVLGAGARAVRGAK